MDTLQASLFGLQSVPTLIRFQRLLPNSKGFEIPNVQTGLLTTIKMDRWN